MLSSVTAAAIVAGLCAVQGAALLAMVTGWRAWADCVALLCPLTILALCLARMPIGIQGVEMRPVEVAFLTVNVVSAVVAATFLLRHFAAAPVWGRGAVWVVNSLACAAMVYLAFFFRLF